MKRSQGDQSGPKAKPEARLAAAKEGVGDGEDEEASADSERARRPSGRLAFPLEGEAAPGPLPPPPLALSAAASSNSCSGAGASAADAWKRRRHESEVSSTACAGESGCHASCSTRSPGLDEKSALASGDEGASKTRTEGEEAGSPGSGRPPEETATTLAA